MKPAALFVARKRGQLRIIHHFARTLNSSTTSALPQPDRHAQSQSPVSLSLWSTLREARPAVRYTVYAGLGIMALVESTFWFKVLKINLFPSASREVRDKDDRFLETVKSLVKGYKAVWMKNYNRYYGAHLWGLSYGGLDGLDPEL